MFYSINVCRTSLPEEDLSKVEELHKEISIHIGNLPNIRARMPYLGVNYNRLEDSIAAMKAALEVSNKQKEDKYLEVKRYVYIVFLNLIRIFEEVILSVLIVEGEKRNIKAL